MSIRAALYCRYFFLRKHVEVMSQGSEKLEQGKKKTVAFFVFVKFRKLEEGKNREKIGKKKKTDKKPPRKNKIKHNSRRLERPSEI